MHDSSAARQRNMEPTVGKSIQRAIHLHHPKLSRSGNHGCICGSQIQPTIPRLSISVPSSLYLLPYHILIHPECSSFHGATLPKYSSKARSSSHNQCDRSVCSYRTSIRSHHRISTSFTHQCIAKARMANAKRMVLADKPRPLANVALAVREISRDFPNTEMFLLDMWPAYPTSIVTFNPESGVVLSQKYQIPKPLMTRISVEPIVGGPSLLSMNGMEWKTWRTRLNPGFSATSLNEHIP